MRRRNFLQQLLILSCGGAAVTVTGCGTILHSERVHRPHSRDIDWKIAALNGLGLALFFVPGVMAFVVDFYTGAIYLPPAGSSGYPVSQSAEMSPNDPANSLGMDEAFRSWQRESVPPQELHPERIEQVVEARLGSRIKLSDSSVRVSKMTRWSQYPAQIRQHLSDACYGITPQDFFASSRTS